VAAAEAVIDRFPKRTAWETVREPAIGYFGRFVRRCIVENDDIHIRGGLARKALQAGIEDGATVPGDNLNRNQRRQGTTTVSPHTISVDRPGRSTPVRVRNENVFAVINLVDGRFNFQCVRSLAH